MQTQAAVLIGLNQPLRITDITMPGLAPGQVLVEVAYSGVCHSQLLEARGKRGHDPFLPHTLGHEGSGTVLQIASGVTKVQPGDRVVLSWIKGEGCDVPSVLYRSSSGLIHSGAISTFMRRTIASENRLTRIPSAMPLREAALLGCAVPTGGGVVFRIARVQAGSSVAVFGVGGIGLSAVLAAGLAGASPLIAIDIMDHKLRKAISLGATHAINAAAEDPLAAILRITADTGVDFAIEAAGRRETMETAFRSIHAAGGLCILAGNLTHGERISIDPFDLIRGKRIIGTWGGGTNPDEDIPHYASLYLGGKLLLGSLITHEYSLEEINRALDDLEQGRAGRAVIDMQRHRTTIGAT